MQALHREYTDTTQGHSGFLAINIANQNQLVGWLQRNPADVITMHLGTNDVVRQDTTVDQIIAAFTKMVQQMRDSNPGMKIIVRYAGRTKGPLPFTLPSI